MAENLENTKMPEIEADLPDTAPAPKRGRPRKNPEQVTISNEVHTAAYNESQVITLDRSTSVDLGSGQKEIAWHDLKNSMIKHKILTGRLTAMERHDIGDGEKVNIAVADYCGYRIIIPISEMNIILNGDQEENRSRKLKITSNMIGCEIDFIVTHMDPSSYSVVASRKQAMNRKAQDFFIEPTISGNPVINVGSVVQARVVVVTETVLRLEVFGVECFARVYDISAAWIADARKRYYVGDTVYVKIKSITLNGKTPSIEVEGTNLTNEKSYTCQKQGKYYGTVTGIYKGVYFLRLDVGTNAMAHAVEGTYLPKKEDQVAFVCTKMDEEKHVAIGMITRIVKVAK